MHGTVLVSAQGISRYYGRHRAIEDVRLELRRGEVLGFLGPNGAGKSTTMQILSGVLAPHAGRVEICGVDLALRPAAAKRHLGYLPEIPPLYRDALVDEYLHYCARLRGLSKAAAAVAVARAKSRCGLDDVAGRLIANLSKGYQQRVGIAQAIVHDPDILILDEPTAGLDPNQIREVRRLIGELASQHAVILSTHILSEVQAVCSRVSILHEGHIVFDQAVARGCDGLCVGLRKAPARGVLEQFEGVHDCAELGNGRFRLLVDDPGDVAERLVETAAREGWGLREIGPAAPELEQTFVRLTCRDTSPERPGGMTA